MNVGGPRVAGPVATAMAPAIALAAGLGSAQTNLQLTEPILWVMIGISVAGAIVTFSYLVYAVWKFRDPTKRSRRYG